MSQEDILALKLSAQASAKDIKYIRKELEATAQRNVDEHNSIKELLTTYKKDCAGIWVENAMKAVAMVVLLALVAEVLSLIIK